MTRILIDSAHPLADLAASLRRTARERHGLTVRPAGNRPWGMCYTRMAGKLQLWYNDAHGSTHMVAADVPPLHDERICNPHDPNWWDCA